MFNDDDGSSFAVVKKRDLHNFLTFMNKPDDPEHQ